MIFPGCFQKKTETTMIPQRFQRQIETHLVGNMLGIEGYPLILAIIGKPGVGKTWQLRTHLKRLNMEVFSVSSADLESDRAGEPAKLLKEQYLQASLSISRNVPAAIVIDDIDTTVGEWENNTGTVNHQGILAFLMHIADHPNYIEGYGRINRVPIFLTGNRFELLYEPLRRTGRMLRFDWEPTLNEKIDIVSSLLWFTERDVAERVVSAFPEESISFYSSLITSITIDTLADAVEIKDFSRILSDSQYKLNLIERFEKNRDGIDWLWAIKEYSARGQ